MATATCDKSPRKKAPNCQEFKSRKTIKDTFLFQGEAVGTQLFCLGLLNLLVHGVDCGSDWWPVVSEHC